MSDRIAPKLLAEFIGTFSFVFIGAGAAAVVGDGVGLPGIAAIALAHGLTIMAFAYGSVSGMTPPSPKRSANCFGQSGTVVPNKPRMKSSPIGMPGLAIDSPHYRGP